MKKAIVFFVSLTFSFLANAQEERERVKELGILFTDFESFGLTYRFGSEKAVWRLNALFLNGSSQEETSDSLENNISSMGGGFRFGRE